MNLSDSRRNIIAPPPTRDPTKMTQSNQTTVMLADNFPAKAYLLVTHLTEADPQVASFSSDGNAFEIYDQSSFAQKYLPQYFKHSNYGSFVRQLNLYGFTSSRLKQDNDVVVWTHEFFRRDRKDLVKEIKRTKKTKSAKPSHVQISPRSPSPASASLSDDVSSTENAVASKKLHRKVSGVEQGWLESEFTFLKAQNREIKEHNRCLEEKLDTLLQITLRISPVSLEEVQVGEKRRRMSPVESNDAVHAGLEPIYEEQKLFYDDNYGSQYEGDRKPPAVLTVVDRSQGLDPTEDSYKRFVDIMLNQQNEEDGEAEEEECKVQDADETENIRDATSYSVTPANTTSPTANNSAASPTEADNDDIMEDELMQEAMNAILPGSLLEADGDLFSISDEPALQLQVNDYPTGLFTRADAAVDKAEGPEPIHIISPEDPTVRSGDIEEGNLPVGVTVIAAQAELVDDGIRGSNTNEELLQQQLERESQHRHKYRKRVICLLAFIGIVLAVGVTWPAVVNERRKSQKAKELEAQGLPPPGHRPPPHKPNKPCPFGGGGGGGREDKHGGGCFSTSFSKDDPYWRDGDDEVELDDEDQVELHDEEEVKLDHEDDGNDSQVEENSTEKFDYEDFSSVEKNATETWSSYISGLQSNGRKRAFSLFSDIRERQPSSLTITIEGTNFVCSSREDML